MASTHTEFARFRSHYRELDRRGRLQDSPLILSEGDSWFSLPLYHNLVDWLEVRAAGAVFLRLESSGDQAVHMFSGGSLRALGNRLQFFAFDVLLLSAGGNDLVGDFLRKTFRRTRSMAVDIAVQRVVDSGRFEQVRAAYQRAIDRALQARPDLTIITHGYDYPRLLGEPIQLTVEQVGLVALLKRRIGDWISRHIATALPDHDDRKAFARRLIDRFHTDVLVELKGRYGNRLVVVDFRGRLDDDDDWNDEMHPTAAAFERLAVELRTAIRCALSESKRAGIGF